MTQRLSGVVAMVALGDAEADDLARALAGEGAAVILVASGADRGGRVAADLRDGTTGRVAVFCRGDDRAADVDALVELAGELSPRR